MSDIPVKSLAGIAKKSETIVAANIHTLYGYSLRDAKGEETVVKFRDGSASGAILAVEQVPSKGSPKIFWPDGVEIKGGSLYLTVELAGSAEIEYVVYWL